MFRTHICVIAACCFMLSAANVAAHPDSENGDNPHSHITGISSPSVTEGNSGTKNMTFVVSATCGLIVNATVDWQLNDGTATTADNDYVDVSPGNPAPGIFTACAGGQSGAQTYNLNAVINGDTDVEPDETLEIQLSNASVGSPSFFLDVTTANGTIENDDFEVDIQVEVAENTDPVVAGSGADNLVYTTTVTNNGPGDATGIDVDGTIDWPDGVTPGSCSIVTRGPGAGLEITRQPAGSGSFGLIGSLASGASADVVCPLTVGPSAPDGGTVTASASLTSVDQPDTDETNDSDSETTSIDRLVDLQIDVTESTDPVVAGSGPVNLTHTVTISNNGPSDISFTEQSFEIYYPAGVTFEGIVARGPENSGFDLVRVTEGPCPAQECFSGSGSILVGAPAVLNLGFTVDSSAAVGTDVITTSVTTVTTTETDTNPENDDDSESTSIAREIDIVVEKTDNPDPVVAGLELSGLQYVVTVTNNGPSDADAVVINDPTTQFPSGVVVENTSASDGGYDGTDWTVNLPAGDQETLTFTLTVGPDAPTGAAAISNTATFTGSGGGETAINTGDDSDTEETEVIPTTATWTVSKDFLDDNGSAVTMTLSCEEVATMGHNTDAVESGPVQVSEGAPMDLTVTGFLQGPFGTTSCEVTESNLPPEYFQVGTEGDCDVADVLHDDEFDCEFTNAPIRATFTVTKDFNDGNPAGVEIFIECTTGLPMMSDAVVYETHPIFDEIEFIVQDYDPYELDCTIYENVPVGYSEFYDAGYDEVTSVFNILPDSDDSGCHFLEVASGDFTCHIDNTLDEVAVTVDKIWIDDLASENGAFLFAGAKWHCDPVATLDDDGRGFVYIADNWGHLTFHGASRGYRTAGSPSKLWDYDYFTIFPHYDGSHCSVTELELDSDVFTDDSDCDDIEVFPGHDLGFEADNSTPVADCVIINTRIYAGIPTLSEYGLALLALMMLGIGFVAYRRFA